MFGCTCLSPFKQVKAWTYCILLLRFYASCQLNLFITKRQMKSSMGKLSDVFRFCYEFLVNKFSIFETTNSGLPHPSTARDFQTFLFYLLGVDLKNDFFFIENGKVKDLFTETNLVHHFMKPLAESISKVQFTWRSHPLVSKVRHFLCCV